VIVLAEHARLRTPGFAVRGTVSAFAASAGGVEANGIACAEVFYLVGDGNHGACAIAAENARQSDLRLRRAAPNQKIAMIERGGLEFDDGVARRLQSWNFGVNVTKLFNATVVVELYRFQRWILER
jgi:hypothetical protein